MPYDPETASETLRRIVALTYERTALMQEAYQPYSDAAFRRGMRLDAIQDQLHELWNARREELAAHSRWFHDR